ncbi:MAG: hypothetical protein A3F54_04345 [Candidatus Kerfeldbacteria bacterium RIFCSPHIGHO2_12_FULL_48_17]|uniref:Cytosol aminopeptidase domain-containing protein n=1 Tax=Candidatus Kerfeldbacteria bacterium RIFCSPHIGHO2_12_FULL_48_17 TaxID=1798542 RepID=A0A1G2B7D5_9BACT|nr:MAG: hypothetical protein A3F54_04345 [Candidatus Kerfeldbacteria bacterium RIFCSPHIGHO2_12_FULL_48_17]
MDISIVTGSTSFSRTRSHSHSMIWSVFSRKDRKSLPMPSGLSKRDRDHIRSFFAATSWQPALRTITSVFLPDAKVVLYFLGLGSERDWTRKSFITTVRWAVRQLKSVQALDIVLFIDPLLTLAEADVGGQLELLTQNVVMANYEYVKHKTIPTPAKSVLASVRLITDKKITPTLRSSVRLGQTIGEYVNFARDLSNESAGVMNPRYFMKYIQKTARTLPGLRVRILSKKDLKRLGMNTILAVGQGSAYEPGMVILEYTNTGTGATRRAGKKPPVVFVGKGITYDTGGLNMKPPFGAMIEHMHLDMSGGAAVTAAVFAAARLKLKTHVVGLIPVAENMVSAQSVHPGDIIKTMSGKTVRISNTDAEGRLVLCDALTYAESFKPEIVVDVATLTGSALRALGKRMSSLHSQDDALAEKLLDLGQRTGDYLWRMPLLPEHLEDMRDRDADLDNLGGEPSEAGSSKGAGFLAHFTGQYRWAHIDMAPRDKTTREDVLARGATGECVRLLIAFLRTTKFL